MAPQADYVVSNGTGAAVRSDINGQLAAIVSNNSGATEPATMYAYQWWPDTTTGLLKQRNSANSAWVTIGTLASTNLGLLPVAGGTMTGVLAVTAGTAALPAIAVSGDLNTGIYSPGADQIGISTGGTSRIVVDASGNVNIDSNTFYVDAANNRVGIGTITPSALVSLKQAAPGTIINTDDGTVVTFIADTTGNILTYGTFTSHPVAFKTANGVRATIDTSGRLLVGVSANANGGILQLSSGITFPATAVAASDANTLDDYEEGTWTPTVFHNSVQVTSLVAAIGTYIKIGRIVYLAAYATKSSSADLATGTWEIRNVPFTIGGTNYPLCTFNGSINSIGSANGAWSTASGGDTKLVLLNSTLNTTSWASGYFELYASGCFSAL